MRMYFLAYVSIVKAQVVVAAIASLSFLVVEAIETSETNARVNREGISSLNEAELHQYIRTRVSLWTGFENAYFEHQRGVLGNTEYSKLKPGKALVTGRVLQTH